MTNQLDPNFSLTHKHAHDHQIQTIGSSVREIKIQIINNQSIFISLQTSQIKIKKEPEDRENHLRQINDVVKQRHGVANGRRRQHAVTQRPDPPHSPTLPLSSA